MSVSENGVINRDEGTYTIRFERHLNHPVDKVWAALTRPEEIAKWLASAEVDPKPGGTYILKFMGGSVSRGHIIRIRDQALLEYSWHEGQEGDSEVCWELIPQGPDSCLLILTHTRLIENVADFGAGWHTHIDLMDEVLSGVRDAWSWDDEWWRSKRPMYVGQVS